MRSKLLIAIGAALLGVGAGWLISRAPAPKPVADDAGVKTPAPEEVKVPLMPPPRKLGPEWMKPTDPTERVIPLSEIYAVPGQKGTKELPIDRDEALREAKSDIEERLRRIVVPMAFFVPSNTIYSASYDTVRMMRHGHAVNVIRRENEEVRLKVWLFVSLGTGPNAPHWEVIEIKQSARDVQLRYNVPFKPAEFGTGFQHYYFVPLTIDNTGTLAVRLVDADSEVEKYCFRVLLK